MSNKEKDKVSFSWNISREGNKPFFDWCESEFRLGRFLNYQRYGVFE